MKRAQRAEPLEMKREKSESPGGAKDSECPVPQSYTSLHYHLIFSTKNRVPSITPVIRERLWEYLGGIVRNGGGIPI